MVQQTRGGGERSRGGGGWAGLQLTGVLHADESAVVMWWSRKCFKMHGYILVLAICSLQTDTSQVIKQ